MFAHTDRWFVPGSKTCANIQKSVALALRVKSAKAATFNIIALRTNCAATTLGKVCFVATATQEEGRPTVGLYKLRSVHL
jgi:hypothetical protein